MENEMSFRTSKPGRRFAISAAIVLLVALPLSACGDDSPDSAATSDSVESSTTVAPGENNGPTAETVPVEDGTQVAYLYALDADADPPLLSYDQVTVLRGEAAVNQIAKDGEIPNIKTSIDNLFEFKQQYLDELIYVRNENGRLRNAPLEAKVDFKWARPSESLTGSVSDIDLEQLRDAFATSNDTLYANPNDIIIPEESFVLGTANQEQLDNAIDQSRSARGGVGGSTLKLAPLSEQTGTLFELNISNGVVTSISPFLKVTRSDDGRLLSDNALIWNEYLRAENDANRTFFDSSLPAGGYFALVDSWTTTEDGSDAVTLRLYQPWGVEFDADSVIDLGKKRTIKLDKFAKFEASTIAQDPQFYVLADYKKIAETGIRVGESTMGPFTDFIVHVVDGKITLMTNIKYS